MASGPGLPDSNQFSSSSEHILNLLCELERGNTSLLGLSDGQQLDEDEKVKIENIRKQLMSCDVQSPDLLQQQQQQQHQHQQQQHHRQQLSQQLPQQQQQQIPPQQQQLPQQQQQQPQHHLQQQQQQLTTQPQQQSQHPTTPQHVGGIQSNSMYLVNTNSPSPSWQQQQQQQQQPQQPMSPYSPQSQQQATQHQTTPRSTPTNQRHLPNVIHNTNQQQSPQQHPLQQQQPIIAEASPQIQPLHQQQHHPLQQHRSPSQSVSPPATSNTNTSSTSNSNEPSPVVKKNPLLNAQLVNTRAPSTTSTRFMSQVQTSVLHQNPILNAKLSQGSYPITSSTSGNVGVVSPVNPQLSLSPQPRYIQQTQPQQQQQQQNTNFNFDITQQPQNAQQHTPQQVQHMTPYASGDRQQFTSNQVFRTNNLTSGICSPESVSLGMRDTSPSGSLSSQQVKQEIRRKVSQPKQQHQPTSLLKQLLSDDNR